MKTIIALLDFSEVTPQIMIQTEKLARAFQSHVILLHGMSKQASVTDVGLVSPTIHATPTKETIEADFEKLDRLARPLTEGGIKVSMLELREPDAEQIVQSAQRHEADLIIVGSHHHSAFYNLLVGSITSDILKSASCPVLVVPSLSGGAT